MKAVTIGSVILLLIGNEILSMLAVILLGITFIATIMKERIEK